MKLKNDQKNKFPPQSAGRKMTEKVPFAFPEERILDVKNKLFRKIKEFETINYIYVIDGEKKLIGVFSIKEIFKRAEDTKIKEIMQTEIVKTHPFTDQERVAILALKHNLKSIPVVDKADRFLGVVSSDTILNILDSENVEDILRFAGIQKFDSISPRKYFKTPIKIMISARLPWLIVGLFGGILAAQIIGFFEHSLEEKIILAAFIPLITYMADAISTQTETLFVRNIAFDPQMNIKKFLSKEIKIGIFIALVSGSLVASYSLLRFQSPYLGVVLGISLFSATFFAILVGVFIPWLINKFKKDPALGTGPLTTVLQDVLSVATYFIIATVLLNII